MAAIQNAVTGSGHVYTMVENGTEISVARPGNQTYQRTSRFARRSAK